jgi:hypothetical protein
MANSAHIGALAVMDPDRYPLSTTQRQRMVEARAAVAELIEVLKLAERTIAESLAASGYRPGTCTDEWVPEIRAQVAALVPIRAALAKAGA